MSVNHESVRSVTIIIDGVSHSVPAGAVSAVEILRLPSPPLPPDYDLWLEQPGDDRLIQPGDVIDIVDGMVFYAVPRSINPGSEP